MRKGFTLIELLVVIAIIAILAALLFPSFMRAKEMANTQKCLVHGRELGMAMMMYMEDYSGRFPSRAKIEEFDRFAGQSWIYNWPGDPRPGMDKWTVNRTNEMKHIQMASYVKSPDIWICPNPSGLYGLKHAYGFRCSWCFLTRQFLYDQSYPDTPFQTWPDWSNADAPGNGIGRTVTEVISADMATFKRYTTPATKIFALCYALGPDVPVETYAGSGKLSNPYYPHNQGTIYVYCDGHAKWHETGRAWAPVGYTTHRLDKRH